MADNSKPLTPEESLSFWQNFPHALAKNTPHNVTEWLLPLRKAQRDQTAWLQTLQQRSSQKLARTLPTEAMLTQALKQWEQLSPKALSDLVRDALALPAHSLCQSPELIEAIITHQEVFAVPSWLRRFARWVFGEVLESNLSQDGRYTQAHLRVWTMLLATCYQAVLPQLQKGGVVKPRHAPLVATLQQCVSVDAGFNQPAFEACIEQHLPSPLPADLPTLYQALAKAMGFASAPAGLRFVLDTKLFDFKLAQLIKQPADTDLLAELLALFCDARQHQGRERLVRLLTSAYGDPYLWGQSLEPACKGLIQKHLLATINDPRLSHAGWLNLKSVDRNCHDELRRWFVQADFELFFKLAFKNSIDPHGRSNLWRQYLNQVTDVRIFLPKYAYKTWVSSIKDDLVASQVYENYNGITGFIMRIADVVIYEAVETGNSAYIYDLKEVASKRNENPLAKRVYAFFEDVFTNKRDTFSTSDELAHPTLAPTSGDRGFRGYYKSRRFRHDAGRMWHGQVREFLRTQHFIFPDDQT